MSNDLTKKGLPRKSNAGRKKLFEEETIELRRLVPKSQFSRIETIVDYELSKLKK
ncbi:MAG: hypothetical protein V4666_08380 [Bacteroidota bacterium]